MKLAVFEENVERMGLWEGESLSDDLLELLETEVRRDEEPKEMSKQTYLVCSKSGRIWSVRDLSMITGILPLYFSKILEDSTQRLSTKSGLKCLPNSISSLKKKVKSSFWAFVISSFYNYYFLTT